MSNIPQFVRLIQPNLRKIDAIDLDVEDLVSKVASYGANMILLNGGGMIAWYPTKLPFQQVNEYLDSDFLGKGVEAAHRHNLAAIARIDNSKTYQSFFVSHPDWFRKNVNGEPIGIGPLYETCMNGPFWQEVHFQIIEEILNLYPVDGIFYNHYVYRPCESACSACDQALKEIAERIGVSSKDSPDVRYQWMIDFTKKIKEFIGNIRPDVALFLDLEVLGDDLGHSKKVGWSRGLWALQEPVNALSFNRLTRPFPIWPHKAGENAKFLHAAFDSRSKCVYVTYSAIFGNRRVAQPPYQLAHDIIQSAANGAGIALQIPGDFSQDDTRALPIVRDLYRFLQQNEALYKEMHSCARVALMVSQTTADSVAQKDPIGRFQDEYAGWYEALLENHIQFDVIDDFYITNQELNRYQVIILPNVAALSDANCKRLDDFVDAGGMLLATHETSLFNSEGNQRVDFGLHSLGRRYNRTITAPGSYLSIENPDRFLELKGTRILGLGAETPYGGFGPLAFGEEVPVDRARIQEAEFVVTSQIDSMEPELDLFWIPPVKNNIPEYSYWESISNIPGFIRNGYGKGNALYLPWMPGRLVHRYGLPGLAEFLAGLVKQMIGSPYVQVTGPKPIEATFYQLGMQRYLLHLINAVGLYTPSRELVPVGPLSIELALSATKIIQLNNGELVNFQINHEKTVFHIPKLNLFEALVIETTD